MRDKSGFSVVMLCPVAETNAHRFVALNAEAAAIYKTLGAEATEISRLYEGASKYGCAGIAAAIDIRPDETLFVITDRFRDQAAFETVSALADDHPEINALFKELSAMVQMSRVVRFECREAIA
jgi:hypothetical protein